MSHTPTPWHLGVKEAHHCVYAANGDLICDASPFGKDDTTKTDAAFIVRACNSHDALVAALDELLEHIEWRRRVEHETTGPNDCTHRARTAIQKARGQA